MQNLKKVYLSMAGLLLSLSATSHASPLIFVNVLGSTTNGSGYSSTVTAQPGQTIYYELTVTSAGTSATNSHAGSGAYSPTGNSDTMSSLPTFTLQTSYASINLATDTSTSESPNYANSNPFLNSNYSSSSGTGAGNGSGLTTKLVYVNASTSSAENDDSSVSGGIVLVTGSMVVGSQGETTSAAYYGAPNGGPTLTFSDGKTSTGASSGQFHVGTHLVAINSSTDGGASPTDPLLGFDELTIAVPEPTSLGLLALGGIAMMRRRRTTVARLSGNSVRLD